jgi:hypothetical protein
MFVHLYSEGFASASKAAALNTQTGGSDDPRIALKGFDTNGVASNYDAAMRLIRKNRTSVVETCCSYEADMIRTIMRFESHGPPMR